MAAGGGGGGGGREERYGERCDLMCKRQWCRHRKIFLN